MSDYNDYDGSTYIDDDDYYDGDYDEDYFNVSKTLRMDLFRKSSSHDVTFVFECKTKEGKIEYHEYANNECFGVISGMSKFKETVEPLAVFVALRRTLGTDTFMKVYYDWIFDPKTSPWRMLIPKEGLQYEADGQNPYVRIPVTRETSAQALVSFLIASRAGTDLPDSPRLFDHLLSSGWDQYRAFYTSMYLGMNKDKAITDLFGRDWYTFSARVDNQFSWIKEGTPQIIKSKTLATLGMNYGPIQAIWYKGTINGERPNFYKLLIKGRKYDGAFPNFFKYNNYTLDMPYTNMPTIKDLLSHKSIIEEKVA